ncbi:hypothetical protein OQA88_2279 [Cercophora sp. LCS_1]
MALDPVSVIGAIQVLGATSSWVTKTVLTYKNAPRKVLELQHDCTFTRTILEGVNIAIQNGGLMDCADSESLRLLQHTINEIRTDIDSVLPKLLKVNPSLQNSRMDRWKAKSVATWKTHDFNEMQRRMHVHRDQVALFANINSCLIRSSSFSSGPSRRSSTVSNSSTDSGTDTLYRRLAKAIRGRDLDQVKQILLRQTNPKFPSDPGRVSDPLHIAAARNRHLELIQDLINICDEAGLTLLHRAAFSGDTELATVLLDNGANPLIPDSDGKQPLHFAALRGHQAVVLQLLRCPKFKVVVDAPDNKGLTPLILAAGNGHDPIVHSLIIHGADVVNRSLDKLDAFYAACAKGHIATAFYLLGRGADINGTDRKGNTPLHVAAKKGRIEMVRWLLRMGADKAIRSHEPFTGMSVTGTAAEVVKEVQFEEEGLGRQIAGVIEGCEAGQ